MTEATQAKRPIRILVAKPGLDGHDVGAKLVCRALMDAGMEVFYSGLKRSPEEIASEAKAHEVDAIGLSILSGAHIPLCEKVLAELARVGLRDKVVLAGGNIPERDVAPLERIGIEKVFGVGSSFDAIVEFLRARVRK